jgi:hypothetical protein
MWSLRYAVPLDTFSDCFVQLYKVALLRTEITLKETVTLLLLFHACVSLHVSSETLLLDHMCSKISYTCM